MIVRISYYREDKPYIFVNVNGEVFKVKAVYATSRYEGSFVIKNHGDKEEVQYIEAGRVIIDGKVCYIFMD
ncbi:MAG: hypothetical protein DRO40_08585 [Thermoprotei archaeon]|nr:MAG: hypothetical protein DRO40_08585 [Thermoprotei archaeon]